jgi:hypothetical protein
MESDIGIVLCIKEIFASLLVILHATSRVDTGRIDLDVQDARQILRTGENFVAHFLNRWKRVPCSRRYMSILASLSRKSPRGIWPIP